MRYHGAVKVYTCIQHVHVRSPQKITEPDLGTISPSGHGVDHKFAALLRARKFFLKSKIKCYDHVNAGIRVR